MRAKHRIHEKILFDIRLTKRIIYVLILVSSGAILGGITMAYFLKKSMRKNGLYLQIYESFHDSESKSTRHKAIKTLGYVSALKERGIDDPIAFYSDEIEHMNQQRRAKIINANEKLISESPIRNIGYFLAKAVMSKLKIESQLMPYNMVREFEFNIFQMLEALVYSRIVSPSSKLKTWQEVIPALYGEYSFSLEQIYEACHFFGEEYERIIEVFNHQIKKIYGRETGKVYFDCTNYYFEIDYEREDKQKGPSKENRKEPIIGMALMLDEHQIPIGMKMYPGNCSEKPYLRNMVKDLKERNNIIGKTVQVADKGLNCGQNIYEALQSGDGYIFSKSVKMLPAIEKDWVFLEGNGQWRDVRDINGELLYRYKECFDNFKYPIIDENGNIRTIFVPEKRILIYSPSLAKKQQLEIRKLADKAANLSKSFAKRNEFGECSKYVSFSSLDTSSGEVSDGKDIVAVINNDKIENDMKLAGYNLLVTSETEMKATEIYSVYHNLWKIEESFRILKGQLDARPVYLQTRESIYGHFLICYLAVTILRILQYMEFHDELCANAIVDFIRSFQCIEDNKTVINVAPISKVKPLDDRLKLGLTHYYLSDKDIHTLMSFQFQ